MRSEAKLLELIKQEARESPKGRVARHCLASLLETRLDSLKAQRQRLARACKALTHLQRLNWALLAGSVTALFYLAAGFADYRPGLPAAPATSDTGRREDGAGGRVIQLSELMRRNVFEPLLPPAPPKVAALPRPVVLPPPRIPISQKASRLRLVGIINAAPMQAIIEDQARQRTLYATDGQTIGDVQVERVLKDRVILKSDDERLDLML